MFYNTFPAERNILFWGNIASNITIGANGPLYSLTRPGLALGLRPDFTMFGCVKWDSHKL